jgi:hypothetical protein
MPRLLKKTNGEKLLKEVVIAATGGKSFKQATREIAPKEKDALSRVIGRDVEEWRMEFAAALRRTGTKLLQRLEDKIDDIKPDALAYSLAVVADKASAIEGRNQVNAASVNIQVNNYGSASKEDLISLLSGSQTAILRPVEATEVGSLQRTPEVMAVDPDPTQAQG